jgi:bifunctional non-homologous end joining protein LigD
MLRLYQPCLPTRSLKAPTGPLWMHEIKHDGFRIVARRIGGVVRLQTKQGYDYAKRYPLIVEAISRLKVTSIVIDGEAMCFTGAAHDFERMITRRSFALSICWNSMARTIGQSRLQSERKSYSS